VIRWSWWSPRTRSLPVGIGVEFLSSGSTRLGMVTAIASCRVRAGYNVASVGASPSTRCPWTGVFGRVARTEVREVRQVPNWNDIRRGEHSFKRLVSSVHAIHLYALPTTLNPVPGHRDVTHEPASRLFVTGKDRDQAGGAIWAVEHRPLQCVWRTFKPRNV